MADDALSGLLSSLYAYPAYDANSHGGDIGEKAGEYVGAYVVGGLAAVYGGGGAFSLITFGAGVAGSYAGEAAGRPVGAAVEWSVDSLKVAVQELSDWRAWAETIFRELGYDPTRGF